MTTPKRHRGFTIMLVLGQYAGFGIKRDGPALRIVLGFISLSFIARDFEMMSYDLLQIAQKMSADQIKRIT